MVRSTEGEGDRVGTLCQRHQRRADPITLTLVRCAPSTSPARAGEVTPRSRGRGYGRRGLFGSSCRLPNRRMTVSKERNRGHKEAKKPKANKKPTQAGATFLRPQQPASPKPVTKEPAK